LRNNKFQLISMVSFIIFLFLCVLPVQSWAQGIVCIASGGNAYGVMEQTQLQSTLTNLGYTIRITSMPSTSDCQVYVSYPGSGGTENLLPWVQAGHGIVQISDWGPFISNDWVPVTKGSPQTVEVIDPSHPITAGLPSSWTGRGFWVYGSSSDYIGWDTFAGGPNLIRAGGYDRALSARTEGSGRYVYIGWNVYGSAATANDVRVLMQAITWAGAPANPYPILSCVGAICYYGCTIGSCPTSHCIVNVPGITGCMDVGRLTYCGSFTPIPPSSCAVFLPQQFR
jgi:hypothetical protein